MNIYKKFHDSSLRWANSRHGLWALLVGTFADASVLPLPVTTFFLLLLFLDNTKAYKYAIFSIIGTMAGSLAGYMTGHFAWHTPTGEFSGIAYFFFTKIPGVSEALYSQIHLLFIKWDFWILFLASFTPIPYNLFSVSSGVFEINILIFFFATLLSQGIKFFLLSYAAVKLGPQLKKLTEFNWRPVAIVSAVSLAIIFLVTKAF